MIIVSENLSNTSDSINDSLNHEPLEEKTSGTLAEYVSNLNTANNDASYINTTHERKENFPIDTQVLTETSSTSTLSTFDVTKELQLNIEKSGLVMIETPSDKIQETVYEEATTPRRTRRRTRNVETTETGPLMQVETRD